MCRYVFVNCMFPPKKKKDDFYIHKNKIEKVIEEIKNLEVRKCKNNNFHLWV